ncbi:WecB/TagA/CpsF family glycosyltransferase [Archangium violaceum]|uniref:WecB/TagA/CpsF family glycosyltransferase n=1 Tax=Archangium violaceum TaxID=83451 RepID=UPI00193AE9CA|nr:WecB/TagA/CpsF family glycosyltransferase [Archangium violaceum]QRK07533.1 WecB/TagA/CpsF family glycosyltransferase [Archangium violaceum]
MNGVVGLETPRSGLALPAPSMLEREPGRAFPRVRIGHVALDMGRLNEVLQSIEGLVTGGQGGRIVTPDVEQVALAEEDAALRESLATADLSLAGGAALVRAAQVIGAPLPERRAGAEWLPALARLAGSRAWRVLVVAERPGLAEWTACELRERYRLLAVGVAAPGVPEDGRGPWVDRLLERMALTRPELVLVSMATPKQELFCQYAATRLNPAVLVGTGVALESLLEGRWASRPRRVLVSWVRWVRRGMAFLRVLATARRGLGPARA